MVLKMRGFALPQFPPFAEGVLVLCKLSTTLFLSCTMSLLEAGVLSTWLPSSTSVNLLTCTFLTCKKKNPQQLSLPCGPLPWGITAMRSQCLQFLFQILPPPPPFFLSFPILFQDFRGTINQFQGHIKAAGSSSPQTTLVFPFPPVRGCL